MTRTLTLTVEQLDFMLGLAADVGCAKGELARAEYLHGLKTGDEKRRLYRDMYAARKYLARCEAALASMRRRVGAEESAS